MVKSILRSPITTVVLFVLAAVLLAGGTIGGAQAALNIQSTDYIAETKLTEIHVALTENGVDRENSDQDKHVHADGSEYAHTLLNDLVSQTGGTFEIGHVYDEVLAVRNSGDAAGTGIDQYVRVTVYKYWVDKDGNKKQGLDPSLIDLHFVTGNGWTIDEGASTDERTVLYYSQILTPAGAEHDGLVAQSTPFADTLTISNDVLTETNDDGTLAYVGCKPEIKVIADAVQTHNADAAKVSAWGRTS